MILSWLIPPEGPRTPTTVSTRTSSPSSTGRRLPGGRTCAPRSARARPPSRRRSAVRPSPSQAVAGCVPRAGGGYRRRHVRSSWGAAATTLAVIVAAALLDPSGLAAPVAWTGAQMARQPWTWLQYVVLAPLIVRAGVVVEPATARRRDPCRTAALGVQSHLAAGDPRDDGGQAGLLRGAHGARPARGVRGWAPAGSVGGLPGLGHGVHRHQGRRLRLGPGTGGGGAVEPGAARAGQVSPRGSRPRRAR